MIKVTAQQRANAIEARDVMWPSVPAKNVTHCLAQWRPGCGDLGQRAPDCGTFACFGGWCAWWPAFRDQGVFSDERGAPVSLRSTWPASVSFELFGDSCLFATRFGHDADCGFRGTDHALVTNRLNWLIENSEVTA